MKVAVVNVAASESGALEILKSFYDYVGEMGAPHEWLFILSANVHIPVGGNVNVMIQKRPKQNWLFRVYWELFVLPRLIRDAAPDVILSLQNTHVLFTRRPQVVYVHQPLPFATLKLPYVGRTTRVLALYRDVFDTLIRLSLRKGRKIVVQTAWMKDAIIKKYGFGVKKIVVIPPCIRDRADYHKNLIDTKSIFYPATAFPYKRIDVAIRAVQMLRRENLDINLILTISGNENQYARQLISLAKRDGSGGVSFLGRLERTKIIELCRSSIMVFPSVLESFGLPLVEARSVGSYIIAVDLPYAREILLGYPRVVYFTMDSAADLALKLRNVAANDHLPEINTEREQEYLQYFSPERTWGRLISELEQVQT
jgi:glycosyltransferase involved in cell wall biosynthesis